MEHSCQPSASEIKDFKDLKVWQKSHKLTLELYRSTASLPREEMYGLTAQIRRACVSVAANIAEGCGRQSEPDFARFLQIAAGSASELEYHLLLAYDLGLFDTSHYNRVAGEAQEIKRMLTKLIQKLKADR
jgi:four helix bundle protein